jgi:paraquat-inducible protein A
MATATGKHMTAKDAGLAVCHDCHKLIDFRNIPASALACPRCGATVHMRHPGSLNNTWALVITAVILTFPANLLPIMTVEYLGQEDLSTIMDGIVYFFQSGSYGIGAVIFTASILVPCFKMIGIVLILLSIHFRWRSWLRHKTVMFRFIKFIGRWSMLDIFVIALMQVLVTFSGLSTSGAGPAATFFTGVVLATMFAATTFDTRLLWDV